MFSQNMLENPVLINCDCCSQHVLPHVNLKTTVAIFNGCTAAPI